MRNSDPRACGAPVCKAMAVRSVRRLSDGAGILLLRISATPSGNAVSKLSMERAFSPLARCDDILGLRPRLIWNAPLALISAFSCSVNQVMFRNSQVSSAEGAASYQPGAQPQDRSIRQMRAESPLHSRVLGQPRRPGPRYHGAPCAGCYLRSRRAAKEPIPDRL